MSAAAFVQARARATVARRTKRERLMRPIKPLPAETAAYSRAIRALLSDLRAATETAVISAVERNGAELALDSVRVQDDFAAEFRSIIGALRASWFGIAAIRGRMIVQRMFGAVSARHRERFRKSVEESIGVDLAAIVSEEGVGSALRIRTEENVALIRSIPEEYLAKVERAVYQHVIHGQPGQKSLAKKIREIGQVSEGRAKFIARDQTSKLVSVLNRERNLAIGIEEYVWRTSKDERVRPTHRANEGKRFRWDDPPAKTGHPSDEPNCRCTASPILKL